MGLYYEKNYELVKYGLRSKLVCSFDQGGAIFQANVFVQDSYQFKSKGLYYRNILDSYSTDSVVS